MGDLNPRADLQGSNFNFPAVAATRPVEAYPTIARPAAVHPAATHPIVAHHDVAHPAAAHPDAAHPATAHPITALPAAAHPAAAHPAAAHHGAAHPAVAHPFATRPAAPLSAQEAPVRHLVQDLETRDNLQGDDVSFPAVAAARPGADGKRCIEKVEMIEETEYDEVVQCDHSYDRRCHTTYVTTYDSQQEQECEENF